MCYLLTSFSSIFRCLIPICPKSPQAFHSRIKIAGIMNEKRQQARTQGRFGSGSSKTYSPSQSGSHKKYDQKPSSQKNYSFDGAKEPPGQRHAFPSLNNVPKAEVISAPGKRVLSRTQRGESSIYHDPDFISPDHGDWLFDYLLKTIEWNDKKVFINGQEVQQPRLVAWYGPLPYTYSGLTMPPKEFPDELLKIKRDVENALKKQGIEVELNSVLLNLYRDEHDSVAWHSDDEASMGICPTIASVSLGETRRFQLRHKTEDKYADAEYVVHLEHGSLIVMDGVMQEDWQHRVPKEFHQRRERINLTFRTVYAVDNSYTLKRISPSYQALKDVQKRESTFNFKNQDPYVYVDESFPSLNCDFNLADVQRNKKDDGNRDRLHQLCNGADETSKKSEITKSCQETDYEGASSFTDAVEESKSNMRNAGERNSPGHIGRKSKPKRPSEKGKNQSERNNASFRSHKPNSRNSHFSGNGNWSEAIPESEKYDTAQTFPSTDDKYEESHLEKTYENGQNVKPKDNSVESTFNSSSYVEFDEDYRNECTRLERIYDYVSLHYHDIPFSNRDLEELDVLYTVIDDSGPLKPTVLKAICKRMNRIVHFAESRPYHNDYNQGHNRRR